MFAVVEIGGKQYKVSSGDVIRVPSLGACMHQLMSLKRVLILGTATHTLVGSPVLSSVRIITQVLGHDRMDKVMVFKKKRRKHYMKLNTHRQKTTTLKILLVGI